jgi:hypothetical protein
MSLRNEPHKLAHEQHKVPVTSLQFYSDELLLAGEGTHLVAYSTSQKVRLGAAQIFRSQAIHRSTKLHERSSSVVAAMLLLRN